MILLVDDDERLCNCLKMLLEQGGYEVAIAHDGLEVIRLLDEGLRPSVILMDFILPNMGGMELVDYLSVKIDAPVLILTGHVDAIRKETRDKVKGVIPKPVRGHDLISVVSQFTSPGRFVTGSGESELKSPPPVSLTEKED